MSEISGQRFNHLSRGAAQIAGLVARPRLLAVGCVLGLTGLAWCYLALAAARTKSDAIGAWGGLLLALCQSMPENAWQLGSVAAVVSIWAAMTFAMMLPSAAPMILTYADIAETAAHKGDTIVSPLVFAAGYGAVWIAFSVAAGVVQILAAELARVVPGLASAGPLFTGAIFIGAGLYQFSNLKHACLTRCRQPLAFFFTNWATTSRGVFGLGLRQGLYCLGCCWAMMLVMVAVGAMNIVWMAALAAVATLEKMLTGQFFSRAVGAALLAGGIFVASASLYSHWAG